MDYIYGCIDPGNIDYTGLQSDTAKVSVDNDARTIKVDVNDDVGFDIRKTLPKDADGKYLDGEYRLTAVVLNGVPSFNWTSSSTNNIRYGVTALDAVTAQVLETLNDGGAMTSEVKLKFEALKQKVIFAYPKVFGRLTSIKDGNTGFEVLSGFEANLKEVQLNDATYYVYQSGKSTGSYIYTFII